MRSSCGPSSCSGPRCCPESQGSPSLPERFHQRLRFDQVVRVEALCEPAVDGGEGRAGVCEPAVRTQQAREAGGGPQLLGTCPLLLRNLERSPEQLLCLWFASRLRDKRQLALAAMQLSVPERLAGLVRDRERRFD